MRTYQDLTIDELRKLFYAAAIVGAEGGFCTDEAAHSACDIFEVFAKTLTNPSLIEIGLRTLSDVELKGVFN